jgi:hypothetical protein
MARLKRTSKSIVQAQQRVAGLTTIDPNLDLGNNLTLAAYEQEIARTQAALDAYNNALAAADAAQNVLQDAEKALVTYTERMRMGVAAKHGKDSHEYELAGGTRISERRRRTRATSVVL